MYPWSGKNDSLLLSVLPPILGCPPPHQTLVPFFLRSSLRAHPDKTQVTAFHLRNMETKRSLKVKWGNTELDNTDQPKYLGVTLDRTLSYKQHIHNTKMRVTTCNNLLRKLANSKWGTTTAFALCYSSQNMQYQYGRDLITLTYWI